MASTQTLSALLLLTAALAPCALAADGYPSQAAVCLYSCQTAVGTYTFASPKGVTYEEPRCQNDLSIRSTYLCGRQYCSLDEYEAGTQFLEKLCTNLDHELPGNEIVSSITAQQLSQIPVVQKGDKTKFNRTIIPEKKFFQVAYNSNEARRQMAVTDTWLACSQYFFWAAVVLFGMAHNILSRSRRSKPTSVESSEPALVKSSRLAGLRSWVVAPASLFKFAPGPAALTMILYLIFVVLSCAFGYSSYTYPATIIYKPAEGQTASLIGRRIANVTLANLPLVWLFALRNNPLIISTGWEFNTFNFFHKWLGRIVALAAIAHGIAFTKFEFIKGGAARYSSMFNLTWWNCGIAAVVLFAANVALANRFIRQKIYDIFVVAHIALAAVILAMTYIHISNFNNTFVAYVWVPVGLWLAERVVRAGRILVLTALGRSISAQVSYHEESNVLRIDATRLLENTKPQPGAHYYLYTPESIFFWQSHPFTLVEYEQKLSNSIVYVEEKTDVVVKTSLASSDDTRLVYSFVIGAQDGFTKRLARLVRSKGGSCSVPLLLEGPYGTRPPIECYEQVDLLIGGSGISVGTSAVYAALRSESVKRVRLVWAVRSTSALQDVVNTELRSAMEDSRFKLEAYVFYSGWF